jgi:hypothetical protein
MAAMCDFDRQAVVQVDTDWDRRLLVRPSGHDIWPIPPDHVDVIAHDGIGEHIHAPSGNQRLESPPNPLSAARVVRPRLLIDTRDPCFAHTSLDTMANTNLKSRTQRKLLIANSVP